MSCSSLTNSSNRMQWSWKAVQLCSSGAVPGTSARGCAGTSGQEQNPEDKGKEGHDLERSRSRQSAWSTDPCSTFFTSRGNERLWHPTWILTHDTPFHHNNISVLHMFSNVGRKKTVNQLSHFKSLQHRCKKVKLWILSILFLSREIRYTFCKK